MFITSRISDIAHRLFQNAAVGAEVVHQGVGVVDLGDVVHHVADLLREGEPEGEVGEALALEVVVTAEDVAVAEGLGVEVEVEDSGADQGEEVGAREVAEDHSDCECKRAFKSICILPCSCNLLVLTLRPACLSNYTLLRVIEEKPG